MANDGTGLTSTGLMGLPHFRSSRVSREMYEPIYLNLFTVEIELPEKLKNSYSDEDKNLLLEDAAGVKIFAHPWFEKNFTHRLSRCRGHPLVGIILVYTKKA